MDYLMLILRLIHILAGVFWVGSALTLSLFVRPSVNATGEAGQQVIRHIMTKTSKSTRMAAAGGRTVLAGAVLYWLYSDGFTSAWRTSDPGIGFGIGAIAGLLGFIFGIIMGLNSRSLGKLSAQIKSKPTNEQSEKLSAIQRSQAMFGPLNTIFLIVATIFMAISRYIVN